MSKGNRVTVIIISIIFTLALLVVFPINEGTLGKKGIRLGLDLVGGSHLVYQAHFTEGATGEEKARDVDRALETIRHRIDKYGITEPIIQKQEGGRILVQLPGFTDIEEAKRLVEQTGFLEFREVELDEEGKPVYLSYYLEDGRAEFFNEDEDGSRIFVDNDGNPVVFLVKDKQGELQYINKEGNPVDVEELKQTEEQIIEQLTPWSPALLSWIPARGDDGTQLTGSFLDQARAYAAAGITGTETGVGIRWNEEGGIIFDQIAKRLYGGQFYLSAKQELGIFLDDMLISHPWVRQPAYSGEGVITGNFAPEEVNRLAILLESGALPMPLEKPPLYQQKVSATLGADFIDMSLMAGLIGMILVLVFMMVYYRIPGALASAALIFYAIVVLAIFKYPPPPFPPVTLTLAGIGGFVLSIGMAVDANILIFERMKEELRLGRTLGAAVEAGFSRAWPAIRDSNITTFIICGILYILGSRIVESAPVMGFAIVLAIGVAVSMFTAIVVTRTLLRILAGTRWAQRTSLFSTYSGKGQ
ncbi:Protein translocase subunit SecD [subsurface metagenome]